MNQSATSRHEIPRRLSKEPQTQNSRSRSSREHSGQGVGKMSITFAGRFARIVDGLMYSTCTRLLRCFA